MKKPTRHELIVGLVFVFGLLILGFYTIFLSGLTFEGTKQYVVHFEKVYGLKKGDAVRVEGKEAGEVVSLRALPQGGIRGVIQVGAKVVIFRHEGEVRVVPFSPLGGRVVEITRGSKSDRGIYEPYDKKVHITEADVKRIEIGGKATGELLETLNELVAVNEKNVTKIITNLKQVTDQLTETDSVLGYLINDGPAATKLDGIVSNMHSASQRIDNILARVDQGEGIVGGLVARDSLLKRDVEGAVSHGRGAFRHLQSILERTDKGENAAGLFFSDKAGEVPTHVEGIVADVRHITHEIAQPEGGGTFSKLVHDDRLYEGTADTFQNLGSITKKIDEGHGLLGVLTEEEAGDNVRRTLDNLADITDAVNDPDAGALGMIVHDPVLRGRIARIAEDIERLVVEFRDSLEDVREQAPVNAFIGAVFAAF